MDSAHGDNHDPFNTNRPVVYELSHIQRAIFYPVAWVLWLYFRSFRLHVEDEDRQQLESSRPPRVVIVWHNRSLVVCEVVRRLLTPERFVALISPSKMAAWEVALFEFMRLKVVRGSTTRRSIQAGMELLRILRKGADAGISPDGPSGPIYSFQSGAVALARKEQVPVLILVPNCRFARRLNTWDRHLVPCPFARINVRAHIISPEDPVWDLPLDAITEQIKRVCLEMTEDPF